MKADRGDSARKQIKSITKARKVFVGVANIGTRGVLSVRIIRLGGDC